MKLQPVLTCEHGGNRVPVQFRKAFGDAEHVLQSHRGYDPGALELAKRLARSLGAPLFQSTTTRLLVELNRSRHHRALFSAFTRELPAHIQEQILALHWHPYRQAVETALSDVIARKGRVLHISVHSFTPVLDGCERRADVGLLYDSRRGLEGQFCTLWRQAIHALSSDFIVRRNYPYLGKSDGLTTFLRKRFPVDAYLGIELEVNQKWPMAGGQGWKQLQRLLSTSVKSAIDIAADGRRMLPAFQT